MGKWEIAVFEQFLLFPQCFQRTYTPNTWKPGLFGKGLTCWCSLQPILLVQIIKNKLSVSLFIKYMHMYISRHSPVEFWSTLLPMFWEQLYRELPETLSLRKQSFQWLVPQVKEFVLCYSVDHFIPDNVTSVHVCACIRSSIGIFLYQKLYING